MKRRSNSVRKGKGTTAAGLSSRIPARVRKLHAYAPGEQPKVEGLIKLNTNENPYPPSPRVIEALREACDGRLRLYPNPRAQTLRDALAHFHGCSPENVVIGNGSDDLLALATRAFVEPSAVGKKSSRSKVQYFQPSYSLYPVLADIHGAVRSVVSLDEGFGIPSLKSLKKGRKWDFEAALTLVTTPNAPTGRGYTTTELEVLCAAQKGVIVLDEAYVSFAIEDALGLALKYPNVLVARTFSKAYSLCSLRVGYFVGHPQLIEAIDKVRDSYNVNGLAQVAALATLEDHGYYEANFRKIIATRERVIGELSELGFQTLPSQTNFIFTKPPRFSAKRWQERLREKKALVRWFDTDDCRERLRISIGSEEEMNALVEAARDILGKRQARRGR